MLLADVVVPEPTAATPWWLAPAYLVLILAAVLIGVGLVWTIQAERRQSAEHAEADAKARADLDAPTDVIVMRPWVPSDGHPVGVSRVPLRLPKVRVRGGWWKA